MSDLTPIPAVLAQVLNDAGVGVYDPVNPIPAGSIPIAVGGFPGTYDTAIVVTTYAGAEAPDSREGDEYPRLQVRVRAPHPLEAWQLERDTWEALQFTTNPAGPQPRTVAGWWLQDCHAIQSEAEPLGRDDAGRWEYVRNYQLHVNPST